MCSKCTNEMHITKSLNSRKQAKIFALPSQLGDFGSIVFIRSRTNMTLAIDLISACCLTHTQIECLSTKKD